MSACDDEPCTSLIDRYWATTYDAMEAELVLRLHCDVLKWARRDYWMLFSLWAAAFAYALLGATLLWPPIVCAALIAASLALLGALVVWAIRIARLRRLVKVHETICSRLYSQMLSLRRQIAVQCPRECQPQAVRIRCRCE